jgi:hypothetical protein
MLIHWERNLDAVRKYHMRGSQRARLTLGFWSKSRQNRRRMKAIVRNRARTGDIALKPGL